MDVLFRELYNAAIRLNQTKPDVVITHSDHGGIQVKPTLKLTKIDVDTIKDMTAAYGHINATVVVREDINVEQMLDVLAGNRVYIKAIMAINKVDLAKPEELQAALDLHQDYRCIPISAATGQGIKDLQQALYDTIDMIRIYLKPQGQEADMDVIINYTTETTILQVKIRFFQSFQEQLPLRHDLGQERQIPRSDRRYGPRRGRSGCRVHHRQEVTRRVMHSFC